MREALGLVIRRQGISGTIITGTIAMYGIGTVRLMKRKMPGIGVIVKPTGANTV